MDGVTTIIILLVGLVSFFLAIEGVEERRSTTYINIMVVIAGVCIGKFLVSVFY